MSLRWSGVRRAVPDQIEGRLGRTPRKKNLEKNRGHLLTFGIGGCIFDVRMIGTRFSMKNEELRRKSLENRTHEFDAEERVFIK
jgi:hypothetical protein